MTVTTNTTRKSVGAHLGQVKTRAVTAVVVIPVHVEDLLALDGEQARQNTFCETGAQDDNLLGVDTRDTRLRYPYIVFLIHCESCKSLRGMLRR